jgi:hypothetical protein
MDVATTLKRDEKGKTWGVTGFFGETWRSLEERLNFS